MKTTAASTLGYENEFISCESDDEFTPVALPALVFYSCGHQDCKEHKRCMALSPICFKCDENSIGVAGEEAMFRFNHWK